MAESLLLWAALSCYGLSMAAMLQPRPAAGVVRARLPRTLLEVAVALHTLSLLQRWQGHGHGPFTTMHEILSSNLWSLALALVLATWAVREARAVLLAATPVLAVLGLWLLMADNRPGHLPPTYATSLLYLHTLMGKAYLGLLLVAVALGAVPVLRRQGLGVAWFAHAADDRRCDELAHRFAAFAFVFDTLMLIVGAVWAQDAWGRYWAWDPLESWAFASWLALALVLHARATLRPSPAVHGLWLAGTFALAFLTFFGVPFISSAPHKGAVVNAAAGTRRDGRRSGALLTIAIVLLGGALVQGLGSSDPAPEAPDPKTAPAAHASNARNAREAEVRRRFDEGVVMLHARQYGQAITALHRVLELAPQLPEAHVNMGFALLGSGKARAARNFFDGATALKADQANAYYGLALAWEAEGDLEMAMGAMRSYLHLARHDGEDHLRRARAALWEWESKRQAARPAAAAASTPGR